jgi:hypothetical protein
MVHEGAGLVEMRPVGVEDMVHVPVSPDAKLEPETATPVPTAPEFGERLVVGPGIGV